MLALLSGVMLSGAAHAHLMVAQRGTLNLVGDGGFMVLSLPVSAFTGIDDDGDGLLSNEEFRLHGPSIHEQVQRGIALFDADGPLPLQGVMLQMSPAEHTDAAARQLIVLGRFALGEWRSGLRFRMTLFGRDEVERDQEIKVSHAGHVQRLMLAPGRDEGVLFPGAWRLFSDNVSQGAAHVLTGLDHMLFLLVVLASGLSLRQVVMALTCFTLGHAATLAASMLGGLAVSSSIVEPAIAATIVAMAFFDRWTQRRETAGAAPVPKELRLALIFAFALIHGLGLAGALGSFGLDTKDRLWSLAGFNVGVELAQIGVAVVVGVLAWSLMPRGTSHWPARMQRLASVVAILAGSFWFVQRVAGFA